ncbi:hypothetical protein DXG01_010052 [Tephrocybe rancida]|nr:hypothetical protein DXG01_010052 [Tephrocybe rancida]
MYPPGFPPTSRPPLGLAPPGISPYIPGGIPTAGAQPPSGAPYAAPFPPPPSHFSPYFHPEAQPLHIPSSNPYEAPPPPAFNPSGSVPPNMTPPRWDPGSQPIGWGPTPTWGTSDAGDTQGLAPFDAWSSQHPTGPPPSWARQDADMPRRHPRPGPPHIRVGNRDYELVLEPFVPRFTGTLNRFIKTRSYDNTSEPHLKWDMLLPSSQCHSSSVDISWSELRDEPATTPPVPTLDVISESFPWTIKVLASDRSIGVTCGELVATLGLDFRRRVSRSAYDNLTPQMQNHVGASYWRRRRHAGASDVPDGTNEEGLLRLDFLGKDKMFGGIYEDKDLAKHRLGGIPACAFVLRCAPEGPKAHTEKEKSGKETNVNNLPYAVVRMGLMRSDDEKMAEETNGPSPVVVNTNSKEADDNSKVKSISNSELALSAQFIRPKTRLLSHGFDHPFTKATRPCSKGASSIVINGAKVATRME